MYVTRPRLWCVVTQLSSNALIVAAASEYMQHPNQDLLGAKSSIMQLTHAQSAALLSNRKAQVRLHHRSNLAEERRGQIVVVVNKRGIRSYHVPVVQQSHVKSSRSLLCYCSSCSSLLCLLCCKCILIDRCSSGGAFFDRHEGQPSKNSRNQSHPGQMACS